MRALSNGAFQNMHHLIHYTSEPKVTGEKQILRMAENSPVSFSGRQLQMSGHLASHPHAQVSL